MGENIIKFDNENYENEIGDLNEEETKKNSKKNYNAYKEIFNDGVFRLLL